MPPASPDSFLAALGGIAATYPAAHVGAVLALLASAGLICTPWLLIHLGRSPRHRPVHRAALDAFRDARRDALTRLPTREPFIEDLAARLRGGAPAVLLLIDIDRFAELGALHGHRAADGVLVAVADCLRTLSAGGESLARMGGDQFALLVSSAGLETAEPIIASVHRMLAEPILTIAGPVECTASLGACLLPAGGGDVDAALASAGSALRQVKRSGGGGWRFFDPAQEAALRGRDGRKEELREAIAANQIVPYYQPIVDLADGRIVGVEVLARWPHAACGLLQPDSFIPLAEDMQLTGQITQQLMRRVIADARAWPPWLYFAFNVSPGQLRELIGLIRNPPVWPEGALDPARLEVEVTESALMEDIDVAREVMALLQAQGTRVVLDDFGTGYSNFAQLQALPFDRIKIDRSFVIDSAHDPRAQACVRAMLALGRSLGVAMVAEGVETAETAVRVAALGCSFGQGFHYAEAVPAAELAALLRQPALHPAAAVPALP